MTKAQPEPTSVNHLAVLHNQEQPASRTGKGTRVGRYEVDTKYKNKYVGRERT
jgi:hypothetical protein